jgi:hypothetical protein
MPTNSYTKTWDCKSCISNGPHTLDFTQKRNRLMFSHGFLELLRHEQEYDFENVITRHVSWFFLHHPNESAWAKSQDKLPVRISQTIDTEISGFSGSNSPIGLRRSDFLSRSDPSSSSRSPVLSGERKCPFSTAGIWNACS